MIGSFTRLRLPSMKRRAVIVLACALVTGGCIGFVFGPGYSCRDTAYFQEVPVIVKRGDTFALRWSHGTMGFFFQPQYKVRNGALWFSLQGTSSSGHIPGRTVEMAINDASAIAALRNGGAFWWEPDRSTVELQVVEESPEPVGTGRHEEDEQSRPGRSSRP